jgi:hypothetical protein
MSSSENGSIPHAGTGSRIVPGPPSQEELLQNHEEVSSNALAPGEEPAPGLEEECNLRVSKRSIKRPKTLAELLEEKEKLSGVAGERAAKDRANVNEKIKRLVDPAFKKRRNGQNAACQRRRRKALKDSRAAASASTAGSNVAGAAGSSNAASAAMAAGVSEERVDGRHIVGIVWSARNSLFAFSCSFLTVTFLSELLCAPRTHPAPLAGPRTAPAWDPLWCL